MLAKDLQPISLVDDKGFRDFCNVLDNKYVLPTRRTIKEVLLPQLHEKVKAEVRSMLSRADSISVTTDLWTRINNAAFIAVTGHFFSKEGQCLKSKVLDCRGILGHHTARHLQEEVTKVLEDFDVKEKVLMQIPCFAHKLNLCCIDMMTSFTKFNEVRNKLKNLLTSLKQSYMKKKAFNQCQK